MRHTITTHRVYIALLLTALWGCKPATASSDPEAATADDYVAEGEQPSGTCVNLTGNLGNNEVSAIRLVFDDDCGGGKPCIRAYVTTNTAEDLGKRHHTLVAVVEGAGNTPVPFVLEGLTGNWRVWYAVNQPNPVSWVGPVGPPQQGGTVWTLPNNTGFEVNTRHLSSMRFIVEVPTQSGVVTLDPLVILVPKRTNKPCVSTNLYQP